MATGGQFAGTIHEGAAILGSAETSLTVPAQTSDLIVGAASGTLISSVTVEAVAASLTPTTVSGLIYLFLFDGTTNHLYDVVSVTAVTASATTAPFRLNKSYTDLIVPSGWKLRASQSIAGNASLLKVSVASGDY